MSYKIGILASHPIQYYAPWYRKLALRQGVDLTVYYASQSSPEAQSAAGFGVPFEWDVPLLDGYAYQFLDNRAAKPDFNRFWGCNTPGITRIIGNEKFDAFMVHGWNLYSYWQAMRSCWNTKTRLFVRGDTQLLTQRSYMKQCLKVPLFRWFIPKFDAYLVVGKRIQQYYLYYGADQRRMFFSPHAVDNDYFASSAADLVSQRQKIRRQWGILDDTCLFLFAGKFIEKKKPFDFVKAIELLPRDGAAAGLMVGDGPMAHDVRDYCTRNKIPVYFSGFLNQSQMPRAYAASDVLVLPSDARETWGLVVNEAFASGLPAIVSQESGCSEDLIVPGVTGMVFACGNIRRLAESMLELRNNSSLRVSMGQHARRLIEGYSFSRTVDGFMQALQMFNARSVT